MKRNPVGLWFFIKNFDAFSNYIALINKEQNTWKFKIALLIHEMVEAIFGRHNLAYKTEQMWRRMSKIEVKL